MVEILFAAHITQIEARRRKGPDWRHQELHISCLRFAVVGIVAALTLFASACPRPGPHDDAPPRPVLTR